MVVSSEMASTTPALSGKIIGASCLSAWIPEKMLAYLLLIEA